MKRKTIIQLAISDEPFDMFSFTLILSIECTGTGSIVHLLERFQISLNYSK